MLENIFINYGAILLRTIHMSNGGSGCWRYPHFHEQPELIYIREACPRRTRKKIVGGCIGSYADQKK
jgi:hypothetical protein